MSGRELSINCGTALFTMRTVLLYEGYEPVVRTLPGPDSPSPLAIIAPSAEVGADEHTWALSGDIERRRTHRTDFADVLEPERLVESLVKGASSEKAKLTSIRSSLAVNVLAALTQAAQDVQAQDQGSAWS